MSIFYKNKKYVEYSFKLENGVSPISWLGHTSEKVHSKYLHTYKALMREIRAKDCDWD